jgi:drug/metabolite transporter (DMT)-like permease
LFFGYKSRNNSDTQRSFKYTLPAGLIVGCVLFIAASVQQIGMAETSAGKAAFITGLYIVLVPVLGIFLKHVIRINTWLGVVLAALGLYFLCVTGDFTISGADLLELIASFFWAVHILLIDHFVKKFDALKLCFLQFVTCSILSTIVALIFERITIDSLMQTLIPLLYGGICSVGIAYTLQVLGQKHAQPSHAAIILSLETVFASIGGAILLGENLGARGYFGCALMMAGMLLSQLQNFRMSSNKENRSLSSTS